MSHFKSNHAQNEFVCQACKSRPLRSKNLLYHFSRSHDGMRKPSAPLQMLTRQGAQMDLQVEAQALPRVNQDTKTRTSQRTAQDKENQLQQSKRIEDIMANYTKHSSNNATNNNSPLKAPPAPPIFEEESIESLATDDDWDFSSSEFSVPSVSVPSVSVPSEAFTAAHNFNATLVVKRNEETTTRVYLSTLMKRFMDGELETVCRSCNMDFPSRFACLMHFVQHHRIFCSFPNGQDMLDCTGCQEIAVDSSELKPESEPMECAVESTDFSIPATQDKNDDYDTLYGYIAGIIQPAELTTCPYCQCVLPLSQSSHHCPIKGRIDHRALRSVSRCAICFKGFDSLAELKEHKMDVHKQDCKVCGESFATSYTLNQHIRENEHTVATVRCVICREWTDDVFAHLFESHYKEIECRTCHAKSSNILKHHINLHTDATTINCTTCFNGYPSSRALEKHQNKRHASGISSNTERKRKESGETEQVLQLGKRRKYNNLDQETEGDAKQPLKSQGTEAEVNLQDTVKPQTHPSSSTVQHEDTLPKLTRQNAMFDLEDSFGTACDEPVNELTTSKGNWDPGTGSSTQENEAEMLESLRDVNDTFLARQLDEKNRGDYSMLYGQIASKMESMVYTNCPFCERQLTPGEPYHKCPVERRVKQDLLASVSRCSVCLRGFDCLVQLRKHKLLEHERYCKVCGESFGNKYILYQHVRDTQHIVATVRCIICGEWTDDIFGHLFDIHDKAIECNTCNKLSPNILKHFHDEHRTSDTKNCSICYHGFIDQEMLEDHYKKYHTNNERDTTLALHSGAASSSNTQIQSILVKEKKTNKRKRSAPLRFQVEITEIDQTDAADQVLKRRRFFY